MRALCLVALVSVASCVHSNSIECDDGRVCPQGTTCDETHGLCLVGDQTDACTGKSDGDDCAFSGEVGVCDAGVCVPTACGNGRIDPGEVCDDGNMVGGDGCSADCKKIELCGDGILDVGEQCDDGNGNPADACDACRLTAWTATAIIGGGANATTLKLYQPSVVAVDVDGDLYVAAARDNRVWRLDTNGIATPFAGNGTAGTSGDGAQATSAQLGNVDGLAVDGLGNVYVSDTAAGSCRIRRVDRTGMITTIAGGSCGFGGDTGPATQALINGPAGITVDGLGNVYFSDRNNNRVRRIAAGSGIITTIAGDGTPTLLKQPEGLVLDATGDIFVAESGNFRVRRIDAISHALTTVAGNGTSGDSGDTGQATAAQMMLPYGVAIDHGGVLYISDHNANRIRRVATNGTITTIAGNGTAGAIGDGGPATSAEIDTPGGLAFDGAGNLLFADAGSFAFANGRVRRITPGGTITLVTGEVFGAAGDGGAATASAAGNAAGLTLDATGNLYVTDSVRNYVRRVDPTGVITTIAGSGTQGYGGDGGAAVDAVLYNPSSIVRDAGGNSYIADWNGARVRRIDPGGTITTVAGDGTSSFGGDGGPATSAHLFSPFALALDATGNLYIADNGNQRVRRVDLGGTITTVAGNGTQGGTGDTGAATSAELDGPTGLAVDAAGNLYISDAGNNRVRRVDHTTHVITTVAGTGSTSGACATTGVATATPISDPTGLAFDPDGNLFIAEGGGCVVRVDTGGTTTIVAGGGTADKGDGGSAPAAAMGSPIGVAVAADGTLYVADGAFVRRVHGGIITTVAGAIDPPGIGPIEQASLADPRALVVASPFTLFAGGTGGTVEAVRSGSSWLGAVAGRYNQTQPTGTFARFGSSLFGTVAGVAYDAGGSKIYMSLPSSSQIDVVSLVDPADEDTWTIQPLTTSAPLNLPSGEYFDGATLYVADRGDHVVRAITGATVTTFAGTLDTIGFFGDGGPATSALLYDPQAVTSCANGDVFIADTGNNRVRRVAGATGVITTVLGDGSVSSSGDGSPASSFPVNAPLGLACDALGNVYVTSTNAVRLLVADDGGVVDGSGAVETIYGAPPRETFPSSVTRCLTGVAVIGATTVQVVDSCTGLLVELTRATH